MHKFMSVYRSKSLQPYLKIEHELVQTFNMYVHTIKITVFENSSNKYFIRLIMLILLVKIFNIILLKYTCVHGVCINGSCVSEQCGGSERISFCNKITALKIMFSALKLFGNLPKGQTQRGRHN